LRVVAAGLKPRNIPAGHLDQSLSTRIPACARAAMLERENAEAAYLNPSTPSQCGADRFEDGVNDALDITALKIRVHLCDPKD